MINVCIREHLWPMVTRACGHDHVNKFNFHDLSTLDYKIHQLTGIKYANI